VGVSLTIIIVTVIVIPIARSIAVSTLIIKIIFINILQMKTIAIVRSQS